MDQYVVHLQHHKILESAGPKSEQGKNLHDNR